MHLILCTILCLLTFSAPAAETTLKDSEGRMAYLYTPGAEAVKDKIYWLAIGVHGAGGDGKGAAGLAAWAQDDVIVLGPSFVESAPDAEPGQAYQMNGPTHEAKLKALIAEVGKTWKLRPKVFLHGFSAGAQFVHRFAMKNPELVAGVSAASAGRWSDEINAAASTVPFAVSCGEYDRAKSWPEAPLNRLEWMQAFAGELRKAHFDVAERVIANAGHKQTEETLAFAATAFARARALNFSRTVLLSAHFNEANPLWEVSGVAAQSPAGHAVTAVAAWDAAGGMIEKQGTAERTGALRLRVNSLPGLTSWSGTLRSGFLPVRTVEVDVRKLSLAFDLRVSSLHPVRVRIESFDAAKQRTGGLEGMAYPAAAEFYHRHTLDLGAMKAVGGGAFTAGAPFVQISFSISDDLGWPATSGHQLRVDNLCYSAPALYVSVTGKDSDDGQSTDKALATVQQAIDQAQPGDVIMLGDGLYETKGQTATFKRGGSPAAWITLRNAPGQKPIIKSTSWNTVKVGDGNKDRASTGPTVGYIELRGLRVQGIAAEVQEKHAELIGKPAPETNGNGISFDGRYEVNKPHHLRIADCEVFDCPGGGISCIHCDRISIEGNHCHGNCHWMIYAGSGISVFQGFNWETTPGEYRILERNNRCHDNYCTQPWVATGKLSDGNGMIVDDMRNTQNKSPNGVYAGRILVQNNLSYANGGSGMHAFSSDHVDFINNTVVGNNSVMDYSQLGITQCTDCRVLNNIIVATDDQKPVNRVNGTHSDILVSHNLFFGGNQEHVYGEQSLVADPMFEDAAKGDFRLKKASPARAAGGAWEIRPVIDLEGQERSGNALSVGAFAD